MIITLIKYLGNDDNMSIMEEQFDMTVLCCKHLIVYGFHIFFLCLPEASVSGCGD